MEVKNYQKWTSIVQQNKQYIEQYKTNNTLLTKTESKFFQKIVEKNCLFIMKHQK